MALLNPIDGLPVHARKFGELLLGESGLAAGGTDLVTDDPAAVEDPVGRRGGWHPAHAGVIDFRCLYRPPYICGPGAICVHREEMHHSNR
jgi:hypothetical protein